MAFWNSIFCSESYPISIIICHLEITRPQRKSPRVFLTVLFSFSEVVSLLFPLYVIIMSRTSFKVNLHSIVCLNLKELLARSRRHIWSLSDSNRIRTHNHLVRKQTHEMVECSFTNKVDVGSNPVAVYFYSYRRKPNTLNRLYSLKRQICRFGKWIELQLI